MKQLPFYANRPDNRSCLLACLRSVTEYFGQNLSWKELEEITGFKPGKAAWTVRAWTHLARQGFDIKMIEAFDYHAYEKQGKVYLQSFLKSEELKWQLENTNILEIRPLLPAFFGTVQHIQRSPQLTDVDQMLQDNYLVIVQLNSKALNQQEGYVAHVILVHSRAGGTYIAHDPGLPPVKNRRVSGELLYKAMGGDDNTVEVTGLKLHHE